jgi:hypothetical protein
MSGGQNLGSDILRTNLLQPVTELVSVYFCANSLKGSRL